MNFEWDENKNQINQRKHGISFEEAQAVFEDEHAILFDDPDHSESEERFLLIGLDRKTRVCIVIHYYRGMGQTIRIISARKATKLERSVYDEQF